MEKIPLKGGRTFVPKSGPGNQNNGTGGILYQAVTKKVCVYYSMYTIFFQVAYNSKRKKQTKQEKIEETLLGSNWIVSYLKQQHSHSGTQTHTHTHTDSLHCLHSHDGIPPVILNMD